MKRKFLLIINILIIVGFNLLALKEANAYSVGLLLILIMNSIYLSRQINFWKALGIVIFLIFAFISAKYFINYLGNYKVTLSNGDFLPLINQVITSVSEIIIGLITSVIIIFVSQIIWKPKFKLKEQTGRIDQIGKKL
jgi:hypothetical protein